MHDMELGEWVTTDHASVQPDFGTIEIYRCPKEGEGAVLQFSSQGGGPVKAHPTYQNHRCHYGYVYGYVFRF